MPAPSIGEAVGINLPYVMFLQKGRRSACHAAPPINHGSENIENERADKL
jgi:hypothetical protein